MNLAFNFFATKLVLLLINVSFTHSATASMFPISIPIHMNNPTIISYMVHCVLIKVNLRNVECYIILYYYEMVWMAVNCNYSSNFCGNFLCPLSLGNLPFLFTNYIFYYSIHKIFHKQTTFTHMSCL